MSDKELDDGLTDEERAALAEEDGTDETTAELDEGKDEDAAGDDSDAGDAADDDAKDPAAEAAGRDDGADPEDKADADTAEAALPAAPILVADAPQDAEARLTEIKTKKDDLINQFDDGDITAREYQQKLDELAKQEREIEFAINKAEMAAEMERQRKYNEWVATVNGFLNDNKVYRENPRLYKALDQEVKDVSATPEAANWDGNQILAQAHKNLVEAFGLKQTAKQDNGGNKPNIPPTLGKIPAADNNDMNGGRFAALDRMGPVELEEALFNMPESERLAFLARSERV